MHNANPVTPKFKCSTNKTLSGHHRIKGKIPVIICMKIFPVPLINDGKIPVHAQLSIKSHTTIDSEIGISKSCPIQILYIKLDSSTIIIVTKPHTIHIFIKVLIVFFNHV